MIPRLKLLGRPGTIAALTGALLFWGVETSQATTCSVASDSSGTCNFTPNSPADGTTSLNDVVSIPGDPLGGVLSFNLTLNADYTSSGDTSPGASGSFVMELDTASIPFWSLAILSAAPSTPGSTSYGDFTGGVLSPSSLTDTSLWTVGINPGDFPVTLTIASQFAGFCGDPNDCFTPASVFSFTFTPNVATTPLPAGLPLFASGMALMGWVGSRRRRKTQAA
jgi:hypothetical protein